MIKNHGEVFVAVKPPSRLLDLEPFSPLVFGLIDATSKVAACSCP
jgi:hypothetical protein